jgi:hypothetical protein
MRQIWLVAAHLYLAGYLVATNHDATVFLWLAGISFVAFVVGNIVQMQNEKAALKAFLNE